MRDLLLNWLHGKLPVGNKLRDKAPSNPAPVLTAAQAAVGEGLPEAKKKSAQEEYEEAMLA